MMLCLQLWRQWRRHLCKPGQKRELWPADQLPAVLAADLGLLFRVVLATASEDVDAAGVRIVTRAMAVKWTDPDRKVWVSVADRGAVGLPSKTLAVADYRRWASGHPVQRLGACPARSHWQRSRHVRLRRGQGRR